MRAAFKFIAGIFLPSDEKAFAKAVRRADWPAAIALAKLNPEAAQKWRGWDPFEKSPIDALALACRAGMPAVVRGLIEAGFDPGANDQRGRALAHHLAVKAQLDDLFHGAQYVKVAQVLAEFGAPLDALDPSGYSAMGLAASIRQKLLRCGDLIRARSLEALILALAGIGADPWAGEPGNRAADYMEAALLHRASSSRDGVFLSPVGQIWAQKAEPKRL